MDYDVIEAQYVAGYVVKLKFKDGTAGEIDLGPELWGPMFEPLRDLELFKQFRVDPECQTLVWPNGADLAPEFLHDNVHINAYPARTHRPIPPISTSINPTYTA